MICPAGYNDKVFINCPFDSDYKPLLNAIIFTIYRCGFSPRSALDEDDGTNFRLDKIMRCIESCRYGIHDLSRTEINEFDLPRFNMPFEAGLFFAAKYIGNKEQGSKNALVIERTKYLYQKYISDLNGIDTKAHNCDQLKVIEKVRDWLRNSSRRSTIPGSTLIKRDFRNFEANLPELIAGLGFSDEEMTFNDYCQLVEEALVTA